MCRSPRVIARGGVRSALLITLLKHGHTYPKVPSTPSLFPLQVPISIVALFAGVMNCGIHIRCTRHGVNVDQLLWRLLADVKQRFDLARNVPNEAERLSWELPRFLDLAARKGRLVIVIDGLHRLQDKNGDHQQRTGDTRAVLNRMPSGVYTFRSETLHAQQVHWPFVVPGSEKNGSFRTARE